MTALTLITVPIVLCCCVRIPSLLQEGHVHKKLFALCLAEHGGSFSMGEVKLGPCK